MLKAGQTHFLLALCVVGATLAASPATATAQPLPQTVRLVVGYPPGGSVDTVARLIAQPLAGRLGLNVIVDNRPGASGRIAAEHLKHAAPDGGTILIVPNAVTTVQTLVYEGKLNYDVLADFQPVARVASYPFALSASTASGIDTPQQLNEWLKANPGKANYGSSGAGGLTHFAGLRYGNAAGIQWTHVPFSGGAPLLSALLGGHVVAGVDTLIDHYEHQKSGKLKILGIFSSERYPLAPEVPTLQEGGIEGLDISGWFAAFVPARTPQPVVARLDEAFKETLADPAFVEQLNKLVLDAAYLGSSELRALQERELEEWAPIVRDSGFTPE